MECDAALTPFPPTLLPLARPDLGVESCRSFTSGLIVRDGRQSFGLADVRRFSKPR